MLASELIEQLKILMERHGDQDVLVDCPGVMELRGVDEVDVDTDDQGIVIWPE